MEARKKWREWEWASEWVDNVVTFSMKHLNGNSDGATYSSWVHCQNDIKIREFARQPHKLTCLEIKFSRQLTHGVRMCNCCSDFDIVWQIDGARTLFYWLLAQHTLHAYIKPSKTFFTVHCTHTHMMQNTTHRDIKLPKGKKGKITFWKCDNKYAIIHRHTQAVQQFICANSSRTVACLIWLKLNDSKSNP